MATDREPYRHEIHCTVVNHGVTITGHVSYIYAQSQFPVASTRHFGGCTGMNECKIFSSGNGKSCNKPTGCPYFDINCDS